MYLNLVLKCLLIGWINALPAGPAAIVGLRRAIVFGRRAGLASGLGMALADAVYVIIARAGIGRLPVLVAAQRSGLLPLAGLVVIAAGLNTLKTRRRVKAEGRTHSRCRGLLASAFLLSLTNPLMLVSLPALFAALGLNASGFGWISTVITVVSVLGGSMAWWFIATRWIDRTRGALANVVLKMGSALTGIVLIILGIVSLSSLLV